MKVTPLPPPSDVPRVVIEKGIGGGTRTVMLRCQAKARADSIESGLGWWRARKRLRCHKAPFHLGLHTYEERAWAGANLEEIRDA